MHDDDDPGWPITREWLLFVVPFAGLFGRAWLRRHPPADGLVFLRGLFLSFCSAIVGVGIVTAVLYTTGDGYAEVPGWVAVALPGLGGLVALAAPRIERPLECRDVAQLLGSYRTRFFLRIATSETAALLGFVGFILTFAPWSYFAGAAITSAGFARAAPTASNLREDQERLNAAGCSLSLVRSLRMLRPPGSVRPDPT